MPQADALVLDHGMVQSTGPPAPPTARRALREGVGLFMSQTQCAFDWLSAGSVTCAPLDGFHITARIRCRSRYEPTDAPAALRPFARPSSEPIGPVPEDPAVSDHLYARRAHPSSTAQGHATPT